MERFPEEGALLDGLLGLGQACGGSREVRNRHVLPPGNGRVYT